MILASKTKHNKKTWKARIFGVISPNWGLTSARYLPTTSARL